MAAVTAAYPRLARLPSLVRDFAGMITSLDGNAPAPGGDSRLDSSLDAAHASGLPPLATLASGRPGSVTITRFETGPVNSAPDVKKAP